MQQLKNTLSYVRNRAESAALRAELHCRVTNFQHPPIRQRDGHTTFFALQISESNDYSLKLLISILKYFPIFVHLTNTSRLLPENQTSGKPLTTRSHFNILWNRCQQPRKSLSTPREVIINAPWSHYHYQYAVEYTATILKRCFVFTGRAWEERVSHGKRQR